MSFDPTKHNCRSYWLMKTEPDVCSFEDIVSAKNKTTFWEGVRNYQARNFMRDEMKVGDLVLIYHSNAQPSGCVGIAEITKAAYPDHFALDKRSHYYDEKSAKKGKTDWVMVDVTARAYLNRLLSLAEMRSVESLAGMELLRKGSRLSIQPVSRPHFLEVVKIAGWTKI